MTNKMKSAAIYWLMLLSVHAFAQDAGPLKDLVDRGGRKLDKEQLRQLVTGATVNGFQSNARTYRNLYKADGTVTGGGVNVVDGGNYNSWQGTWRIDDDARICIDVLNAFGNRVQGCNPYYLLDGKYFSGSSTGVARPLTIER